MTSPRWSWPRLAGTATRTSSPPRGGEIKVREKARREPGSNRKKQRDRRGREQRPVEQPRVFADGEIAIGLDLSQNTGHHLVRGQRLTKELADAGLQRL